MNLNEFQDLKIGELPELEIIQLDHIVFHEEPDPERSAALAAYIQKDGKLKNPPVVAYYNNHRHTILLDGANRVSALKRLGIFDVLVQKIDLFDPNLQILNWNHAIEKFSKEDFLARIQEIPQISVEETEEADNLIAPHCLARIQFSDSTHYNLITPVDFPDQISILKRFTDIYHDFEHMDRVSYLNLEHLQANYPDFCAVVRFRPITKQELITAIQRGRKMPSGITRIILPKRALHLNIPLDILRYNTPLSEKNHWLQKRITMQVRDKSIRFYFEPTFLFDE